jgi:hypothetical protein
MEQMQNIITKDELLTSAHHHAKPMLGAAVSYPKHIVSYGAGVNSTAMVIEMINRKMPIDAIIFSNTGGELPETYLFIQKFSKWVESKGYPKIVIVKYQTKNGKFLTLEKDILTRKTLPAIAYGYKSCSDKFKIRPFNKWVKENIEGEYLKYIGFDAGEKQRVKSYDNVVFPLYDWGIDRNGCIEIIEKANLEFQNPKKSSCFFCPSAKKHEILSLPDEFQKRCIQIEENAKENLTNLKGLGINYAWKDLFHVEKTQLKMFDEIDYLSVPCECRV